jgi:hypothetical protein
MWLIYQLAKIVAIMNPCKYLRVWAPCVCHSIPQRYALNLSRDLGGILRYGLVGRG